MKETHLASLIHALFAMGITLGTSAAIAQEIRPTLQDDYAIQTVAASADPEGEVSNGIDPPIRAINEPKSEEDYDPESPPSIDSLPESEVGNGMDPPQ